MKRILQIDDCDCGVACVAMLLQRYANCPSRSSYDAARAMMFGKTESGLTKTRDLKKALNACNILTADRLKRFKPIAPKNMGLTFDAVLATKKLKDGSWHWMVWDAKNKMLLDPLEEPYTKPRVVSFLRVGSE